MYAYKQTYKHTFTCALTELTRPFCPWRQLHSDLCLAAKGPDAYSGVDASVRNMSHIYG